MSESEGETEAYEILCLADDYLFYPLPDWVVDQYETELLEDEDGLPLYMLVKGGSLPESVDEPILVPDNAEILFDNKPFRRLRGRRLYQSGIKTIGVSSVLMVRILALDAEPMYTAEELGSRLFDDGATLRGTFLNCSFGGLTLDPGVREGSDIVNGVGSVSVSLNAHESTRRQVVSAATVAINAKYGIANFDHIMFCLPYGTRDGSLGQNWVATGIKNAYRTTFNDEWCAYQSALVHELGHNLALDHSGHNGHPYEDQSCLMGYTYKVRDCPSLLNIVARGAYKVRCRQTSKCVSTGTNIGFWGGTTRRRPRSTQLPMVPGWEGCLLLLTLRRASLAKTRFSTWGISSFSTTEQRISIGMSWSSATK